MTQEQIAQKVAWIIAGMAAEYHGRTIEPGQVFPSDTLVMHGIDDHLALIEFTYLAEKASLALWCLMTCSITMQRWRR